MAVVGGLGPALATQAPAARRARRSAGMPVAERWSSFVHRLTEPSALVLGDDGKP